MHLSQFDELQGEIESFNLAYLHLAQKLIRADMPSASMRLDIHPDLCRLIEKLSLTEVSALAKSPEFLMTPRCTEVLRARLTMIRQGASEFHGVLSQASYLFEPRPQA